LTFGEIELFHEFHLPTRINFFIVYTNHLLLASASLFQYKMSLEEGMISNAR
jgi:hypothetical protein